MNPLEEAAIMDTKVREWERAYKLNFATLGVLLLECETGKLWNYLPQPFHSFDDWLLDAMPCSRSTGYAALQVARRLSHLPIDERSLIGPGNLKTLAEIDDPKITTDPIILDLAQHAKAKEFREKMAHDFPDQHLEPYRAMERLRFDAGQREDVEGAIEMAKAIDGCEGREEAIAMICRWYTLDSHNMKLLADLMGQQSAGMVQ